MKLDQKTIGYALLGGGILIVAMRLFGFSLAALTWPFYVIAPGLLMLWLAFSNGRSEVGLAIPGALVAGTGAILFVLNLTNHWEAWAYMWALYPVFIGTAIMYAGKRQTNPDMERGGRYAARTGLWLLGGFAVFFELLIFGGGFQILGSIPLPLLLIGGGLFLLLRRDQRKPKSKRDLTNAA